MNLILNLIGGIGLLLMGMQLAGEGLQKAAGSRLRAMLNALTANRLSGLLLGCVMTAVMQSSGATTVLLVSFVGSGLLAFEQTIGVILGANIGTTFTVQLIAVRLTRYALALVALGFFAERSARKSIWGHVGRAVLGFGLIFLAIQIFSDAMAPIDTNPFLRGAIGALGHDFGMSVLIAAVMTAAFNSSAAIIGLVIVLAMHGLVTLDAAIPLVLGANLGTTFTSLVSTIGTTLEAKRVALAHIVIKAAGLMLVVPFLGPFTRLSALLAPTVPEQIAMAHTVFNVALAVIFLPAAGPFSRIIKRLLPPNPNEEVGFQIRYLDEALLSSPVLALGAANREVRRMADRVQIMMGEILELFVKGDEVVFSRLDRLEWELDTLTRAIVDYLANLSGQSLTEEQSRKAASILYIVNDLEHIGDSLTKLAMLAHKKIDQGLAFSSEGTRDLNEMHTRVSTNLDMAIVAFMTSDSALAEKVLETLPEINRLERNLRQTHLNRLWSGVAETRATSTIHLDLINGWQRINEYAVDIAQSVLEVASRA